MSLADEIINGNIAHVQQYLAMGADVNEIDQYGFTPLIEAAVCNELEIARLLLEKGAKVNGRDLTEGTALHWSVENNNVELSELLLKNGADPNAYPTYGQPPLVKPLLRHQQEIKELLYEYSADLKFAQDYINTKLIGHRFSLLGKVDIVDASGTFFEIDFEGFILEFTVALLQDSLMQFKRNFTARNLRDHFKKIQRTIDAYNNAAELLKYQQYLMDRKSYQARIRQLFSHELLLLPVGYEGHAITFVKLGQLFAKCDRGENSKDNPTVGIYRMTRPNACNFEFLEHLLYQKHSKYFVTQTIFDVLGLEFVTDFALSQQSSGNCSWANVEGAFPTMLFMQDIANQPFTKQSFEPQKQLAFSIYTQWQNWDQDWALHQCIESFYDASPARKASKTAILAAVLFQTCEFDNPKDAARINKIMTVLKTPGYEYVLKSYVKVFTELFPNHPGKKNLLELIDIYGGL